MKRSLVIFAVATTAFCASAKDVYVSLSSGKNKNAGTKEAPFKNIWKAVEKAQPGDVIHVAEGNYPGKMKCGWVQLDKPVSLIGGYSSDFSVHSLAHYRSSLALTCHIILMLLYDLNKPYRLCYPVI